MSTEIKCEQGRAIVLPPSLAPWTMRVWRDMVVLANPQHPPMFVSLDDNGVLTVGTIIPEASKEVMQDGD